MQGLRHRARCFAHPWRGLCQVPQILGAFPDIRQGQGCGTWLCTCEKAHTTEKWVYSSQADPASRLDEKLKLNTSIFLTFQKIVFAPSVIFWGLNAFHLGVRQTARSPLHKHLSKDLSSLWPYLCSLRVHPGKTSQRTRFGMGAFLGNSFEANTR